MKRSLRSWLWRVSVREEVNEELAFHIEMRTRELVERGMDPTAARELVLSRIGDLGQLTRTCEDLGRKRDREMRLTQRLEEFRDDVTFAFRQMRATPGFTIVAALTLALGIGANSAIFALADAAFLRPLPFTTPHDRLFMLWERYPNGYLSQVTPPDYGDWAEQTRTFDAMAAFLFDNAALIGADGLPEQVRSQSVTTAYFEILGVTPLAGRTFLPSDMPERSRRDGSDRTAASKCVMHERFARVQEFTEITDTHSGRGYRHCLWIAGAVKNRRAVSLAIV